jgi:hypothetical protein
MQSATRFLVTLTALLMLHGPAWPGETPYNLGVDAYRSKDYTSARQHWTSAVGQGETAAMNNLGYLLFFGMGGAPDQARAVSLWTTAARDGQSESQWHLAVALERGEGAGRDLVEAYAWYRCALAGMSAAADDEDSEVMADARDGVIRTLEQLPTEKLAGAEGRARDYIAKFKAKPEARATQSSAN